VASAALPERGPERVLDLCIRSGPFGDSFGGNPDGLTLDDFKKNPNGLLLGPAISQGPSAIVTPSGEIEIAHSHFLDDLVRLDASIDAETPSLVLVSRRQLRSLNSWMHNLNTLVKGKERCTLQMHPDDAGLLGIGQGDMVMVEGLEGQASAPVEITQNIRQGVVSLPHGWGHDRDGLQIAIAMKHPGYNINQISPAGLMDPASGNAVCNGIPVSVRLLQSAE
jgi:anaerobic selenocysteine-containing dehydrogenase